MNDRQRTRATQRRQTGATPDSGSGEGLGEMRASAERLLGIADSAFERIRSQDSRQHLLRHRQRGGQ